MEASTACFQWSKQIIPHRPSSSYGTLASAISSPSSSKRRCQAEGAAALVCCYVHRLDRLALLGASSSKIYRTRSSAYARPRRAQTLRRACSASLSEAFSDEEFSKEIQELALRFQNSNDGADLELTAGFHPETASNHPCHSGREDFVNMEHDHRRFPVEPPWPDISRESQDWPGSHDMIPASIERKANSVDIPVSLRIIKRKMQWQEGLMEAGESACCSVKKAFSSMVFIIREIQSYTLLMREFLFTEDLQGILARVQKEMNDSFVWLFQQVFSHTPTLMVSVMILLANFTVYSMGSQYAIAAPPPPASYTMESVSVLDTRDQINHKFHSSMAKTFSLSSPAGKSASIGGGGGDGGKVRPVGSGTEGDGSLDGSEELRTIVPDCASELSALGTSQEAEQGMGREKEASEIWNSMVEEAAGIQGLKIDAETIKRFVSPIEANIESDDYGDYLRTELLYQTGLAEDPNNPLLLANYAQFLSLVSHDHDRAEEYFKRAVGTEPVDAEAFNKYANFLWKVRDDLWAAEETFLEAIAADPANPFYAASYASFLWTTGGEDTCFPLGSPDTTLQA
ncbi:unnamed protein product [Linum tenue]|uniref:Tetratricopeptide repeat-like superfamily protein n=1 Tax=Linum tenue TaxID=586396 RepID=A0AAV0Q6Y5_9ROSI|nr:unnamed protein product [Linum tenue]